MRQFKAELQPEVLVANADAALLGQIADVLCAAGYDVIMTGSFSQAKHLLSVHTPDLLVADIRLGDFNGLHLAWERYLTAQGMPTIITHTAPDPLFEAEARKLEAPFIVLPVQHHRLLPTVVRLLSASGQLRTAGSLSMFPREPRLTGTKTSGGPRARKREQLVVH